MNSITKSALILASLASLESSRGSIFPLFPMIGSDATFDDPFGKRSVPQTPEPPQTQEQKQWYIDRAQARRDRRAAKKRKQNGDL